MRLFLIAVLSRAVQSWSFLYRGNDDLFFILIVGVGIGTFALVHLSVSPQVADHREVASTAFNIASKCWKVLVRCALGITDN